MKIVLTGGGTGGHVTPLLAVAKEIAARHPRAELYAVCEKNSPFAHLLREDPVFTGVFEVRAGKLRRYGGQKWWQTLLDVKTIAWNVRDSFFVLAGLVQARRLLKRLQPDAIFIKGGFVGVPIGYAASRLKIPFITHDSDTTPGLANRLVARWAALHATGMPAEFYPYPPDKTVFTGIPISGEYHAVSDAEQKTLKHEIGLSGCKEVIAVTGGSQGADKLNTAFGAIVSRLMQQRPGLGIIHIVGSKNETKMQRFYESELLADERRRILVKGFVNDLYRYTGAADVVISRASATTVAELGLQQKACIVVPADLAGGHQAINARHLADKNAVVVVAEGDSEALFGDSMQLLDDPGKRLKLSEHLANNSKSGAAQRIAELVAALASGETQMIAPRDTPQEPHAAA